MFYLTKHTHEDQFKLQDRIMVLADYPAVNVRAGDKGIVTEIYNGGVMITWEPRETISAGHGGAGSGGGPGGNGVAVWKKPSDGFGRDELEYLAVETAKHPKVLAEEIKKREGLE